MNNLSSIPELDQMNSMFSFCYETAKPYLSRDGERAFFESIDYINSSTSLIVKAYKISEDQKTLKHILISIFTFGIFAIIKALQLSSVKSSCIEKLRFGITKIYKAAPKGTLSEMKVVQLGYKIIDSVRNI